VTEFVIGIGIGIGTETEIGIGKLINYLFT
jgi:hypothetical protein